MAPKPGVSLFAYALCMITTGVFDVKSNIPPEWRPNLRQPFTAYAISSFFYTAVGIVTLFQIYLCPLAAPPGWPVRYATAEAVLICLQGIWSYCSDVISIGATSFAHPIDRFSAVTLTFFQVYKFGILLRPVLGPVDLAWVGTTLAIGFGCKFADYQAMQSRNISMYRRSHFWWHVSLPLGFGTYCIYRWANCALCR
jgi:hypothetical protein